MESTAKLILFTIKSIAEKRKKYREIPEELEKFLAFVEEISKMAKIFSDNRNFSDGLLNLLAHKIQKSINHLDKYEKCGKMSLLRWSKESIKIQTEINDIIDNFIR